MFPWKVHSGSPDDSRAETGRSVETHESEADDVPGLLWLVIDLGLSHASSGSTIAVMFYCAIRFEPRKNKRHGALDQIRGDEFRSPRRESHGEGPNSTCATVYRWSGLQLLLW